MLRRPLLRRLLVGLFGGGGGEQLSGEGLELFDGQAGGVFGEEPFHVHGEVVVQPADGVGDDLRVVDPEIAGPQALPVIGIRSASARPSLTRLDAHAPTLAGDVS